LVVVVVVVEVQEDVSWAVLVDCNMLHRSLLDFVPAEELLAYHYRETAAAAAAAAAGVDSSLNSSFPKSQ
jgi:hypothetical protein